MKNYIQNSITEWKYNGSQYRLLTQNIYENSARTEFGNMEIKKVLKISLQKKEGMLSFLATGSTWENIRVEKLSYAELNKLGIKINKYSGVIDEAKTKYGMPFN